MEVLALAAQLKKSGMLHGNSISLDGPIDAAGLAAFETSPKPRVGTISWKLPADYTAWLTQVGCFQLQWFSHLCECSTGVSLLSAKRIAAVSEIIYLPEGVARGDGPQLSTNHLVPFCSAGEEAAFCFDTTQGGDYPVYYNHQDCPRMRLASSGEWEDGADSEPDFENFAAWMNWLIDALTRAADSDGIGHPRVALHALDFTGCCADDCECDYKAPDDPD